MRKVVWSALLAVGLSGVSLPPRLAAAETGCCKLHCEDGGRVSIMVIDATQLECEAYQPQCEVKWTALECELPGEPGVEMRHD